MKNQKGSAGIFVLVVMATAGLLLSDTISKAELEKGNVKINKEVVKERKPVDYSKMNK